MLSPLSKLAPTDRPLAAALAIYNARLRRTSRQVGRRPTARGDQGQVRERRARSCRKANDGPVPLLHLDRAHAGSQRGARRRPARAAQPFYGTDFTKPLLFLEDGAYFANLATARHLTGSQWGVMNETGSYPGQPWLWLYPLWYQVPGFGTSPNVDLIAIYLTGAATILLLLVPFIPGLRDIPRWIPVHRLVWRSWNASQAGPAEPEGPSGPEGPVSPERHPAGTAGDT